MKNNKNLSYLNVFGIFLLLSNIALFFSSNLFSDKHLENVRTKRSSPSSIDPNELTRKITNMKQTIATLEQKFQTISPNIDNMKTHVDHCTPKNTQSPVTCYDLDGLLQNNLTLSIPPVEEPVTPSKVVTDGAKCGGVVYADEGTIQYKPNERYNNNEYCIWTLITTKSGLTLNLTQNGLYYFADMITVSGISENTGEMYAITTWAWGNKIGSDITTARSAVIITFVTGAHRTGKGFQIDFVATGNPTSIGYSATHNENSQGGTWSPSWDFEASHRQKYYHILTQSSPNPDAQFSSDLILGRFHFVNISGKCDTESVTAYQLANGGYQLDVIALEKVPSTRGIVRSVTCPDVVTLTNVNKWFTSKNASFVVVYRQLRPTSFLQLTWDRHMKPENEIDRRSTTKCGGTVIGDSGYISYKDEFSYGVNDSCTWTVKSATPNSFIGFTLAREGFGDCCKSLGVLMTDKTFWLSKSKFTAQYENTDGKILAKESEVDVRFTSGNSTGTGFLLHYETYRLKSKSDSDSDGN